jgi:hypothetical protein
VVFPRILHDLYNTTGGQEAMSMFAIVERKTAPNLARLGAFVHKVPNKDQPVSAAVVLHLRKQRAEFVKASVDVAHNDRPRGGGDGDNLNG